MPYIFSRSGAKHLTLCTEYIVCLLIVNVTTSRARLLRNRYAPDARPNRLWRLCSSATVSGSPGYLGNVVLSESRVSSAPGVHTQKISRFIFGFE